LGPSIDHGKIVNYVGDRPLRFQTIHHHCTSQSDLAACCKLTATK
jgi:hypothetical protein